MNQQPRTQEADNLPSDVWTMADVVAYLRVSPAQVRRLIGVDRTFPAPARVSPRVWRWERAVVEDWLRSGSTRESPGPASGGGTIVDRV